MDDERRTMNNKLFNFGFRIVRSGLLKGRAGADWGLKTPNSNGFTLIEVILIMVIIGILAAVVIPRAGVDITPKASVDGVAYMIASDIRYAQEFAMANRVSKTVTFSTATPAVYTFNPSNQLDPSGRLPEGVTIGSNLTVTFNSLGEPISGGGGLVTISGSGQTRTISIVNYTGKVNIS